MATLINHNATSGRQIEQVSHSAKTMCWTCGSCDFECPVNIATGRLRPQKIVRMANLGMIDELMRSPAIWLCIDCGRCTESCSQLVDGRRLIDQVKELAILWGVVDIDFHQRVEHANQVIYKYFFK